MFYSTAIENMNNIFYCSVKPTYVAFLALTLITTNYCSGTFLALQVLIKSWILVDKAFFYLDLASLTLPLELSVASTATFLTKSGDIWI